MPSVILKPGKEHRLMAGHAWVYAGEIVKLTGVVADGDAIDIRDCKERFLGRGLLNRKSQITVRRFTTLKEELDDAFFRRRIEAAWQYRRSGILAATTPHDRDRNVAPTDSVRIVSSEADQLPGLIVDKFGDHLVLQALTLGIDQRKPAIVKILNNLLKPAAILERSDVPTRKLEGLPETKGVLSGASDGKVSVELAGVQFAANLLEDQKTGFFLDQAVNYAEVAGHCAGKRVLDCFSYHGGFALFAAKAGASRVEAVEISAPATARARANAELNGVTGKVEFVCANAFDMLKKYDVEKRQFDVIILDPPTFTRTKQNVNDALRGYKEINLRALKMLAPGGVLATFSCSHHINVELLRMVVVDAAADARKPVRLLKTLTQSPDHPILPAVPETEYLKGLLLQVLQPTNETTMEDRAPHAQLSELKRRLLEINDLESAGAVLHWDQTTYMPPGGAVARGRQMSTLSRLVHEKFTVPEIGKLLDQLRPYEDSLPPDSDEARLIAVTRRDYERAVKVPASFIAELSKHTSQTYQLWTKARPANDFASVRPQLEKTLDLSRQLANFFPGYQHIADPLIDYADYGMTAATVRKFFGELKEQLLPVIRSIAAQPVADDSCLQQAFPEAEQLAFGREVIKAFGYDFNRGRQDKTHHPFMTTFALGDVRITTRVKENDLGDALFSTLHEAGHAMYEQGICADLEGTPLASGTTSGVHESQSRLWENVVGRSRGFWEHFYPKLQDAFPGQLRSVPLEKFYRAINKVERSLIRTDADEVTYNLHVLIRFDFELQLLEGKLAIRDLPEAWHESYRATLGLRAPDDRDGVLQDVHWYSGVIGGVFQGYTLGNILSAQFYEAATRACPGIEAEIRQGQFAALHDWLRENIYRHGRKFTAAEIVQRATGQSMTIQPYVRYLRKKYGELYRL